MSEHFTRNGVTTIHHQARHKRIAIIVGLVIMIGIGLLSNRSYGSVIGYWRFETDGGSGVTNGQSLSSVDDSSGNGRTGTPIGSPTYITTPFVSPIPQTSATNSFALNNGTDQGVLLSGAAASGLIGSSFTIEAYIRFTLTPTGSESIFRSRNGSGFPLGFSTANNNGGPRFDDLTIGLNPGFGTLSVTTDMANNVNYHVAATYDGTTLKLYLDGVLEGSLSAPGFTGTAGVQAAIGNDPQFPTGFGVSFPGVIDEVRISNVALDPSQFLDASVPEPASLGLLAVGGVTLLKRRRA